MNEFREDERAPQRDWRVYHDEMPSERVRLADAYKILRNFVVGCGRVYNLIPEFRIFQKAGR